MLDLATSRSTLKVLVFEDALLFAKGINRELKGGRNGQATLDLADS
ncbi:hypothetical protein PCAR4_250067 [Paraburkholderia caribensis]|nr:hypothetical protein PCAR4_250067 [Paraburkholderia caribensis]